MADLWLEKELARQLAPVTAPDSLWERIDRQRRSPPRRVLLEWVFWPALAAMVLLTFAGVVLTRGAPQDPDKLTDQELAALAGRSGFDFRSDNFEDIRAWVKAAADIDIDIPYGQPAADRGAVRLLGTRIIRLRGLPVAAIDYRVGDKVATLFVSGKRAGLTGNTVPSKHVFPRERLVSWNMRGETYTIAFSSAPNSRGACLLCHSNPPG